jgi:hypothetical protein
MLFGRCQAVLLALENFTFGVSYSFLSKIYHFFTGENSASRIFEGVFHSLSEDNDMAANSNTGPIAPELKYAPVPDYPQETEAVDLQ